MLIDKKMKSYNKVPGIILSVLYLVIIVVFIVMLLTVNIIPTRYSIIIVTVLIFSMIIIFFTQIKGKLAFAGKIIAVIIAVALIYGIFYLSKFEKMVSAISDNTTKFDNMSVVVLEEGIATDVEDTRDYIFGINTVFNNENSYKALQMLNKDFESGVSKKEYLDFETQIEALYSGEVKAILINEAYREIIKGVFTDFDERTRVIGSTLIESKVELPSGTKVESIVDSSSNDKIFMAKQRSEEREVSSVNGKHESFFVYISGIDTYGPISTTSRSDLNIIAAVNTVTKKIFLLTTPRDYYVMIPVEGGKMDKLTHAGIHGVEVSVGTLENLYGINIDYYLRINETTFIDVVDALGGINVDSEYEFNILDIYYFSKGINHLNGKEALAFASERHSFASGDNQRGKNQMLVIEAILKKAISPAIFPGIGDIIETVSNNFETNMPSNKISEIIKMQLDYGKDWDVSMYNVKGTGDSRTTYSGGRQKLYVMIPDQDTVNKAKRIIQEVMLLK